MSERMVHAAREIAKQKKGTFPLMRFHELSAFFALIKEEAIKAK